MANEKALREANKLEYAITTGNLSLQSLDSRLARLITATNGMTLTGSEIRKLARADAKFGEALYDLTRALGSLRAPTGR